MQVITIRIQEGKPWNVTLDNCSREDATENEKKMADAFEALHMSVIKGMTTNIVSEYKVPGSRPDPTQEEPDHV